MKLLILTPEYRGYGGGIMTFYRHLAPAIAAAGWDVTVLEGSGFGLFKVPSTEFVDGVRVESVTAESAAHWGERFAHLAAAPTLRRTVAASWAAWERAKALGPFDVIEATEFGLLHVPHALRRMAPTVVQCHGGWGQIGLSETMAGQEVDRAAGLALETEAMHHMSARHTNAEANARWWTRQTSAAFETIRPAWRPTTDVHPGTGDGEVDPIIRVFGRIQEWKGPRVAAQAWRDAPDLPNVNWHGRDVALDAQGGSTDASLHRDFPGVWGSRIRPRPPVPPSEVARLQARSLLNLVPSTWDVFNFTAVEAMASARPVACSAGAGANELIEDGRTGFIFEAASPAALTETIRRALALGPAALVRIGAQGREAALAALEPGRQARAHMDAYSAAMANSVLSESAPPAWFETLATPREAASPPTTSHLDQHPLRDLATHVISRGLRKVGLTN